MKPTWVTSAEVTQMTTTAAMRNNPALYFQPMTKPNKKRKNKRPRWRKSQDLQDLCGPPRSFNLGFKFHCPPTRLGERS